MRAIKLGMMLYKRDMCDALTVADVEFDPTDPVENLQKLFDQLVAQQEADEVQEFDEATEDTADTEDDAQNTAENTALNPMLNIHADPHAAPAVTPAFVAPTEA